MIDFISIDWKLTTFCRWLSNLNLPHSLSCASEINQASVPVVSCRGEHNAAVLFCAPLVHTFYDPRVDEELTWRHISNDILGTPPDLFLVLWLVGPAQNGMVTSPTPPISDANLPIISGL